MLDHTCHYCNMLDALPASNACALCEAEQAQPFEVEEGELPSPEDAPGREMMGGWYIRVAGELLGPFNTEAEADAASRF